MVVLSTIAKDAACNSIVDLLDNGSTNPNATIELRTGEQPSSILGSATGTLLGTAQLSLPAFGDSSDGSATSNDISDIEIVAAGTPTWCRFYDRDENAIFDASVGLDGSGADIQLDNVNFVLGGSARITSVVFKMS